MEIFKFQSQGRCVSPGQNKIKEGVKQSKRIGQANKCDHILYQWSKEAIEKPCGL